MKVRTAVVPAAGFGTRFLPVTKIVPKELLPVIDRPMLHYIAEEARDAGITRMVLITSPRKDAMLSYFDEIPELEMLLENVGDVQNLRVLRELSQMIDVIGVHQKEQLGLGHALLTTREVVGDEPFVVYLPDDIISHQVSVTKQMLDVYEKYGRSMIAVDEIPSECISAYGVVDAEPVENRVYRARNLVEKPLAQLAPSNLGIVGRYIFTPAIFDALEEIQSGALGEIQLTDGIALLAHREPVYAYRFHGHRYDVGTPLGMLKASLELAMDRHDIGPSIRMWVKEIASHL